MSKNSNNTLGWLKGSAGISQYAGVSRRTAARWIASGKLEVHRLSPRLILIRPEAVDAMIEELATPQSPQHNTHRRFKNA